MVAYYTWKRSVLEGTPIGPDKHVEFDWKERRGGTDAQLNRAIQFLESGSLAHAS
jgi:carboxyl-terminal processing protease